MLNSSPVKTQASEKRSNTCNLQFDSEACTLVTFHTKLFGSNMPRDMFELDFDGAFKKHVGMTKEEFYKKYSDFMRQGNPIDTSQPGFFPAKPLSPFVDFWAKR